MGLDMFLFGVNLSKNEQNKTVISKTEEMYWRKSNHIHRWFVNHVQNGNDDCNEYVVPLNDLQKLRALCREVIANPEQASELLPTQEGFFFGDTKYDDWYYEDTKDTFNQLDRIIENAGIYQYFTYQSSW